jgi:glucose/mannose-6-phosphate isomerase
MDVLDNASKMRRLDTDDMLGRLGDLPTQCRHSWQLAHMLDLTDAVHDIQSVVVLGMGGSAIAGDLVAGLVRGICPVPILVSRDYVLPAHVNSHTLVLGSSYSGNTEETLTAVEEAWEQDARLVVITTGGKLAAWAREREVPVLMYDYQAQPRAALGYSLCAVLGVLDSLGLVPVSTVDLETAIAAMEQAGQNWGVDQPSAENLAKQIAARLHGNVTVIYGADHLAAVARRWKTQINENSKAWAFWEELPELNHNAIVGYEHPAASCAQIHVVLLCSDLYHPRVRRRESITESLLTEAGVSWQAVDAQGDSKLAQLLTTVFLGDFVSFYLAMCNNVDPTPVGPIARLKADLAASASPGD